MRLGSAVALLLLIAVPARAYDGQVYLSWEECALNGAGAADLGSACLFDEGASALHCAFTLAQAIDDVVGIEVSVDLQHSQATLPDWWRLQGKGECRDGSLLASGNFLGDGVCADPWRDLGGGVALYYPGLPGGQSSQARMVGVYAIRADSARVLEAGPMYYGLKLLISNQKTSFPGGCAGCLQPACLVLNQVKLLRGPGAIPSEITIESSGPANANRATWRGGSGAECVAVPVRSRTWGQIKSLYR